MSVLSFVCTATDSTSLYGLAYGVNIGYSRPSRDPVQDYVILVKSNPNPINLTDITWTFVSSIPTTTAFLPRYSGYKGFVCAVNAQGVFTAFSYDGFYNSPSPTQVGVFNSPSSTKGVRYDPTATTGAAIGQTGPGAWFNMTVAGGYHWQSTYADQNYASQTLFYAGSGADTSLFHAYFSNFPDDPFGNYQLYLGVVNETAKSLESVSFWTLPTSVGYGNSLRLAYANGVLYAYLGKGTTGQPTVVAYTFTGATSGTPAYRLLNITATGDCQAGGSFHTAAIYNSYYLVCDDSTSTNIGSRVYTIEDTTASSPVVSGGNAIINDLSTLDYFQAIGGSSNNAPIALMQWNGLAYTLALDGTAAGAVLGPVNITISNTFNASSTTSSNTHTSLSTGSLMGIIAAVVVVVGLVVLYWCIRNRSKKETRPNVGAKYTGVPTRTAVNATFTQGYNQTEVVAKPGGGAEYIVRPTEAPGMYVPGSPPRSGYAASVPSPVPGQPYPLPQLAPTGSQNQTQIPVQQLHFAIHPRPNFVTSIGDSADVLQPREANTGDDTSFSPHNPAWAPTPFVPPTRPSATSSNVCGTSPYSISATGHQNTVQDRGSTYDGSSSMAGTTVATDSPASSSAPSLPNHSRPSPVRSPQQIVSANNPQFRG